MKLPSSIYILGRKHKTLHLEPKKMNGNAGHYDYNKKIIEIDNTLTHQEKWEVFLHELGHGIMDMSGASENLSDEMQEIITENFKNAYWDFMEKRFGKWWTR